MCRRHREHQKAFYETIFHASILFNSGLSIVPTRNMINNLGATADSTHFAGSVHTLPKGYRRIFTMNFADFFGVESGNHADAGVMFVLVQHFLAETEERD